MRIFLVGYMYSGKTVVGKRLSKMLSVEWIDTDRRVEELCNKTIEQIFEQDGEEFFREKEREVLLSLKDCQDVVVSTGGGLPCYKDNMEIMAKIGKTIYLELTPLQIYSRMSQSKKRRPLLERIAPGERLNYIDRSLAERESFYKKADVTISALNLGPYELRETIDYLTND